jgi:predicted RNA-binding Zn ribbon-like protein
MAPPAKVNRTASSKFVFIGEHPAIDFANTLKADQGNPLDLLTSWADVVDWVCCAQLATEPSLSLPPARGAAALVAVIQLRQEWAAELARLVSGGAVSDAFIERVNALLSAETFHETLRREGKKGFRVYRSESQLRGEELALVLLARQIAGFLAEANFSYLRRCANKDSCVLYFYDTTKNHRRRWCSAAACGNRHKVAEFRKRRHSHDD